MHLQIPCLHRGVTSTMPKVPPPATLLTFQGRKDWPHEQQGVDDWGLTPQQQESYVEQFRRILDAKKAWNEEEHDYFTLRRFLRARSYDLEKATTMWLNHLAWKKDFKVDAILQDFHFHERDKFIKAYPQGYHKLDKLGRPIYIQLLGKIDMPKLKQICSEDRMLMFHIQEYERCRKVIMPVCSRLAGRHIDTTFGIMDVAGVGLSHLSGDVKHLMSLVTKYDQDNYPESLGKIVIINAPAVFRMIWAFVKGLLDPRTQGKIEIVGPNYKDTLLKYVDEENLPIWLGGKSKGELVDDIGPWSDAELCQQIGVNVDDLRAGRRLPALPSARGSANGAPPGGRSAQSQLGKAPSLARAESTASDAFGSPQGSVIDVGTSGRRYSGVPELVVADTMRRYAASQPSVSSVGSKDAARGPLDSSHAEHLDGLPPVQKPITLLDRVAALERALPANVERLKRNTAESNGGGGAPGPARSTRSAIEGSLLNRVEVLEEALDVLLAAQDASLKLQQQIQQQQEKQRQAQAPAPSPGCCVVM